MHPHVRQGQQCGIFLLHSTPTDVALRADAYGLLLAQEKPISAEIIKQSYLGIKEKQKSLLEIFDLHNQRFLEKVQVGKNLRTL